MGNIFRLSFILAIVTLIAAWVLAEIYNITRPQIELQKQAKTRKALQIVLPEAKVVKPIVRKVPVKDSKGNTLYERSEVVYYIGYADADSTQISGYAFMAYGSGYSSIIEIMVGIDPTGKIKKIKIISQKETPGLGARCVEDPPFDGKHWSTEQFVGKTVDDLKVDKDGGKIISITGATITSRAITNAIKNKLQTLLPELGITADASHKIGG